MLKLAVDNEFSQTDLVHLKIRCNGCDFLLMEVLCDPGADAVGVMTCPQCKESVMLDFTDMMAIREIDETCRS